MSIDIRITGPQATEDMSSLYRWLRDEPDIRRNAVIELTYKPGPEGTLGPVTDAIQLVVNDGFELATLVLTYLGWRTTRKKPPSGGDVTIERDGTTVHLSDADPDLVQKVIRELGEGSRGKLP
jgi:hypothetical protein